MDILSDKEMLVKVIDTLKKAHNKKTDEIKKNNLKQLFADDEANPREKVFLVVSLIKLPEIPKDGKTTPMTIKSPIPHSFVDKFTNVLLLTRDIKGHGRDFLPSLHACKDKLRRHSALGLISEIVSLKQLRTEYKDFEAQRNLANQYDIVLCDKKILRMISFNLGKAFYSTKKKPLQINLETKNVKTSLEKCLSRSVIHLNLEGSCSSGQIGLLNQTSEDIADNILSTIDTWKKLMPGGWKNIRSINLKSETSMSIPLFVSTNLPDAVPEIFHPYALKDEVLAADSFDTLTSGNVVEVTRFGDVNIVPQDLKSRENALKLKRIKENRRVKYDPATNKILKNKKIIQKKDQVSRVIKPWIQKPKREGMYFKNKNLNDGINSPTTQGNKQRIKLDKSEREKKLNSISKDHESPKFIKQAKSPNLKRKTVQEPTTKVSNLGFKLDKSERGKKHSNIFKDRQNPKFVKEAKSSPKRRRSVQEPGNYRRNKKTKVSNE